MNGRSLGAVGSRWAIATPHAEASAAGAEAFEAGGNAIDAALAAAVTLAVVYPHMCGVGGDLFAVVERRGHDGGDTLAVNSSGRAPRAADPDALRAAHGHVVPMRGPVPVTVPGAVAGWEALHRLGGRLPFASAFETAIRAAYDGTPVSSSLDGTLTGEDFSADPGMASVFYPDGRRLAAGERFANPALGRTLEVVAAGGAEALYRGTVGAAYVRGLRAAGSPIAEGDLAGHEALILSPLRGRYRDLHASVAPPNSQGFSLLQILAAVERLELDPDPTGPDAGALARVFLAALRDVVRHLADPDRMTTHVAMLLDDGHLAALCDEVRGDPTGGPVPPSPTGDTIALVAADAEGHAVSLIQSLFNGFGSGILEPETGIVAHDRGACFTLEPGLPNTLAPGALPLHTLLPALVHRDGALAGVVGTMGGFQQAQIDAQTTLRTFVLGATPDDAVAAPRFVVDDLPLDGSLPPVLADPGVPDEALAAIEAAGLAPRRLPDAGATGHAHVIRVGERTLEAGTDPRADGAALAG